MVRETTAPAASPPATIHEPRVVKNAQETSLLTASSPITQVSTQIISRDVGLRRPRPIPQATSPTRHSGIGGRISPWPGGRAAGSM